MNILRVVPALAGSLLLVSNLWAEVQSVEVVGASVVVVKTKVENDKVKESFALELEGKKIDVKASEAAKLKKFVGKKVYVKGEGEAENDVVKSFSKISEVEAVEAEMDEDNAFGESSEKTEDNQDQK